MYSSWDRVFLGPLIHYAIVPANYAKPVELTANGQLLTRISHGPAADRAANDICALIL